MQKTLKKEHIRENLRPDRYCGSCLHFSFENIYGVGLCSLSNMTVLSNYPVCCYCRGI